MVQSAQTLNAVCQFAERVADEARVVSLAGFRRGLAVSFKPDESPVTAVDRSVELLMRQRIAAAFPEHGVLGEELGAHQADADYVWSLDPIDGTRSFVTGWPLWGTLLALLHKGQPVLGIIDMPVLGERWVGRRGLPTRLNGQPCHSGGCAALAQATLYTTSPDGFSAPEYAAFERASGAALGRRFGGDCYSYALLASGHVDAVIEADLKAHDFLALVPVIEGAGGCISDWRGRPLGPHSGGHVLAAATPELHAQLLQAMAKDVAPVDPRKSPLQV